MEYKLPEGFILEDDHKAELDMLVKCSGISEEHAQAFVDLHCKIVSETLRDFVSASKATQG